MNSRIKIAVIGTVVLIIAAVIIYVIVTKAAGPGSAPGREGTPIFKTYASWATALDEPQCAEISEKIYARGGTVADAAVASLLCLGVVLPESLGIGGGFLAVYFQKSTGQVFYLDAREVAAMGTRSDMFTPENISSAEGPLSVAVPGELAGYRALLDFVGSKVTQQELFETAIKLAREGFTVGEHLANSISQTRKLLHQSENLKQIYFTEKNVTKKMGEKIYNPRLANTLEKLAAAKDFAQEFYNGTIGKRILEVVQSQGGILTAKDFASYKALWRTPTRSNIQNGRYQVFSGGLSGSGSVLTMMLNIVDTFKPDSFKEDVTTYHRLVESMKFAYAKRTLLGDFAYPNVPTDILTGMSRTVYQMQDKAFAKEIRKQISDSHTLDIKEYGGAFAEPRDHGTSHASFFAPNGDVIAITSTVNFYFGSGIEAEGIILNNEMDDFSTPGMPNGFGLMPSPSNYIKPGKRPLSSMAPAIVLENGEARMAIGAAGGSQITSAIMEVMIKYFYMGYPIGDAIAQSRCHHQYLPNQISHDQHFDPEIVKGLQKLGHKTFKLPSESRGSVIVAIVKEGNKIIASVDPRKGGGCSGGTT